MDVGFAEHSTRYMDSDRWEHAIVASVATTVLGVDVVKSVVQRARDEGWNAELVDATSDADLGDRFDVVVLGDVMEHVGNPEALLRFGRRHLKADGSILLKTPNPLYIGRSIRSVLEGHTIDNADHVGWFTPDTLRELSQRCGLHVGWFGGALEPSTGTIVQAVKTHVLSRVTAPVAWQSIVASLGVAYERP